MKMRANSNLLFALLGLVFFNFICVQASIENSCRSSGTLAMTFDDGPSLNTPDLLTLLRHSDIKVTFHVVVRYLTDPRLAGAVRQAAKDGHDIGIRLDPVFENNMRADHVLKSLINNANYLEKIVGFRPKFVRLPYGKATGSIVKTVEGAGFVVTEQNMDSADYGQNASIEDIVNAFELQLGNAPDGASSFISVQRDIVRNSVLAVPEIVKIAKENGYKVVKLSDCLGVSGNNKNKGGNVDPEEASSRKGETRAKRMPNLVRRRKARELME